MTLAVIDTVEDLLYGPDPTARVIDIGDSTVRLALPVVDEDSPVANTLTEYVATGVDAGTVFDIENETEDDGAIVIDVCDKVVGQPDGITDSTLNVLPAQLPTSLLATETVNVTVSPANALGLGGESVTVGADVTQGVDTVTDFPGDVVLFPAASLATAVIVWLPFVVNAAFHVVEYGGAVISGFKLAPSSMN